MTDDNNSTSPVEPGPDALPHKPTKLRCPYCAHVFEPHAGASCPQCKRVMTIPSSFRSEPRHHKKLSSSERRKLAGGFSGTGIGTKVSNYLMTRQRTRIIIWLVFAFLLLGYFLIRQAYRTSPASPSGPGRQPPEERTMEDLQNLQVALEQFKTHCGRYPTTEEGLKALERQPGYRQWKGPYIIRLVPDPWKTPYVYVYSNQTYILLSAGPDRLRGTPDDLAPLYLDPSIPPPVPPPEPPDPDAPTSVNIEP